MTYAPVVAAVAGLLGALVGIIGTWLAGRRPRVRAFMFCWGGTDDWRLVVQAYNRGRTSTNFEILGVEAHSYNYRHLPITKKFSPTFVGPDQSEELKGSPGTWIADGKEIHAFASSNPAPGEAPKAFVYVQRNKFRPRKVRIRRTPSDLKAVLEFKDVELGWSGRPTRRIPAPITSEIVDGSDNGT